MNPLQEFLIGLRFIGVKGTLQTISYSLYRDWIERRFAEKGKSIIPPASPAKIEKVNLFHNGAYFLFNDSILLEVAFLSTHTVRLTWSPGQVAANYAVGGDETIAIQVQIEEVGEGWSLRADNFTVLVHHNGHVSYFSNGQMIRQDQPPELEGASWTHQAPLSEESMLFGLGEHTRFNLRPGTYHLWNKGQAGSYGPGDDPLHLAIPLYYCQQHAGGYLIFYENSFEGFADFDQNARMRFIDGALRFYVCEGDLPEAIEEYTRLTGRSPLPPRWALGFHHCRWGYRTAAEVREVLDGFRSHQLPLDAFHFDIDYMEGYRVFSVDNQRFPEFDRLLAEMKQDDIHPVVIIDPGVKIDPDYGVYTSGLREDHFLTLPDGRLLRGQVWPGWVHYPDFTKPETRRWWGSYYQRLLEDGVDGIWHDMNEPTAFAAWGENTLPRCTRYSFEGREGTHQEAHNIYALQMNAAAYSTFRNTLPEQRPWMLTRSGWAGVQRYAWMWTGDAESTWAALRMTISTVLGLGVSGIAYAGPDIGGFSGDPDPELYIRWFQMGAMMAFFRNHTAIWSERGEPWAYGPETVDICRQMLHLRKKLMPYLYTLAWKSAMTGAPLARPLLWANPKDQHCWQVDDAYLLGDKILVAPVLESGAVSRKALLPEGGWYHYWDDAHYQGGQTVEVDAPLAQIPFFIKEGAVLPTNHEDVLTLDIYIPQEEGETFSYLYHDAGDGYGSFWINQFTLHRREDRLFLQWREDGKYPAAEKVRIVLHGGVPAEARVDELSVEWAGGPLEVEPFENLKVKLK